MCILQRILVTLWPHMSVRAYLQAVLHKLRDEEGKTVCRNQHRGTLQGRHTGGVTLTPEVAEPVHQPGHGGRREFWEQRLPEACAACWLTPVRGRCGSSFCCPGLLKHSLYDKTASFSFSSSKSFSHKHGIGSGYSWEIFFSFFSWCVFTPISRGTYLSHLMPGNTRPWASTCLWSWNLNQ